MNLKKAVTAGITAAAMTMALGASAGAKTNADSVKVDVRDLDVSSQEGQEALYARLQDAAKEVCGDRSIYRAGSLHQALENRVCYDKALTQAVKSVGHAGVTAIHKTS